MAKALYENLKEIEQKAPGLDQETAGEHQVASQQAEVLEEEPSADDFDFVEPQVEDCCNDVQSFVIDDDLVSQEPVERVDQDAESDLDDFADPEAARSGEPFGYVARIRQNPTMALPFLAGGAILVYTLSSFVSFGSNAKQLELQQAIDDTMPVIEQPQGIDALSGEDMSRRLEETERKARLKREEERRKEEQEKKLAYDRELAKSLARRDAQQGHGSGLSDESQSERIRRLEQELALLKAGQPVEADRRSSRSKGRAHGGSGKTKAALEVVAEAQTDGPVRNVPVRSAAFYKSGVTIQGVEDSSAGDRSAEHVQVGTIVRAALETGVRTDARATVLAKVTEAVVGPKGKVLLPVGTILHGRARAQDKRVLLDFEMATVGRSQKSFRGYALSKNMPGLVGRVIKQSSTSGELGDSALGRRAKSTVRGLVRTIPGASVASDLARNVASEGVDEMALSSGGYGVRSDTVLELKPGKRFDVVVTGD